MQNNTWWISVDYNFYDEKITRTILKNLHCEHYKAWCGINIYDSFLLTDREHSIQYKVHLFDQYISGGLERSCADILAIENVTKAFLAKTCDKAAKIIQRNPLLSLGEVFAVCDELKEKALIDVKCVFSTNYLMSVLSKIHTPPINVMCKAYNPRKLRCIEKGIVSMETIIERYHFDNTNIDEYYMWYELDKQFDLEKCMYNDNLHLIFSNDETDIRNYKYYINHVHIGRELCAICSNTDSSADIISSLNTGFAGQPFVPFYQEMISELHL